MEVNFVESNPIPVKAAMALMGLLEPVWRLPLCPPKPENARENRACWNAAGPASETGHVAELKSNSSSTISLRTDIRDEHLRLFHEFKDALERRQHSRRRAGCRSARPAGA